MPEMMVGDFPLKRVRRAWSGGEPGMRVRPISATAGRSRRVVVRRFMGRGWTGVRKVPIAKMGLWGGGADVGLLWVLG